MRSDALLLGVLLAACSASAPQDDEVSPDSGETNAGGASPSGSEGKITAESDASGSTDAMGAGGATGHGGSNAPGMGGASGNGGKASSGAAGSSGQGGTSTSGSGGAAGAPDSGTGGSPNCAVPHGQGMTKVACVGDSITFGYGASDSTKSYPSQLQGLLGGGYNVGNFGVSSTTMLKNGDFSYWTHGKLTEAEAFLPNVVVIALGINDMGTGSFAHISEFSGDYGAMVDAFRGLASHPVVFSVLPVWVKQDNDTTGYTNARLDQVIALIKGVAADKHLCTIDLNSPFKNHPELFSDTIHPNDTGYTLIAKTVCQAIGGGCP